VAKMTKAQSVEFDKLYNITMSWGIDSNCTGLFRDFGENLEYLATCVLGDVVEILEYNGTYWELIDMIKVDSKTKSTLKRSVSHLMDNGFDTLNNVL